MKYIFRCEPNDFILAGRAIQSAIKQDFKSMYVIEFSNADTFWVRRNKSSISVTKTGSTPTPTTKND